MDQRAPAQLTRQNLEVLEEAGLALNEDPNLRNAAGMGPVAHLSAFLSGTTSAELYLELTPSQERPYLSTSDILETWKQRVGPLEGVSQLTFSAFEDFGGGFQIRLIGPDRALLTEASLKLRERLAQFEGVSNVRDSFLTGQPELRLSLKPEARALGFTSERLATQIGHARRAGRRPRQLLDDADRASAARSCAKCFTCRDGGNPECGCVG